VKATAIISAVLISAGAAGLVIAVLVTGASMRRVARSKRFNGSAGDALAARAILYALIVSAMLITAGAILARRNEWW